MMTQQSTEHTVISSDGTPIGYLKLGTGTPIVITHGSISTGEQWLPVAEQLANSYTVYLMDRRGRGRSGNAEDYSLNTEADDIKALIGVAGDGSTLLGHSYGAICALEAVRTGASVSALVLYEPPLPVTGPTAGPALSDYTAAVEAGDGDRAMRVAAEHFLRIPPEATEAMAASPLWPQMVALTPTWTRELVEIDKTSALLDDYITLDVPTLLLVGENSPEHMTGAIQHLAHGMVNAQEVTLPAQDHLAHILDTTRVASLIRQFLQSLTQEEVV